MNCQINRDSLEEKTKSRDKENNVYITKKIMTPSIKNSNLLPFEKKSNKPFSNFKFNFPITNKKVSSVSKVYINRDANTSSTTTKKQIQIEENIEAEIKVTSNYNPHPVTEHIIYSNSNSKTNSVTENKPNFTKSKRKFTDLLAEKEQAKREIKSLIQDVCIIFDENESNKDDEIFIYKFENVLKTENLITFHKLIPESLNEKGSCLLEYSKFFILYIKYKFLQSTEEKAMRLPLQLDDFILLFNYCVTYDQSDLNLLYKFFNDFVSQNFKSEEILIKIERSGRLDNIPSKEDLQNKHYKYMLSNPECFLKYEIGETSKFFNISDENQSKKFKFRNKNDQDNNCIINIISDNITFLAESVVNMNINSLPIKEDTSLEIHSKSANEIAAENSQKETEEKLLIENNFILKIPSEIKSNNSQYSNIVSNYTEPYIEPIKASVLNGNIESSTTLHIVDISSIGIDNSNNNFSKLSTDAQNYYNDMIIRNKVNLEIEKSNLSFNNKPEKRNFKIINTTFSIIGDSNEVNILAKFEYKSKHIKSKSQNKNKSPIMNEIDEEKTAEDIDDQPEGYKKRSSRGANKSVKSRKRYQSDKKNITNISSEEIEEEKEDKNEENIEEKERKNTNRRARKSLGNFSKNISKNAKTKLKRSLSISAKESEEEEIATKKTKKASNTQRRTKSKISKTPEKKTRKKSKK